VAEEQEGGGCDLFTGEWIEDFKGPRYTNETCSTIESPQNCIRNGRPDSNFLYWRWKPDGCDLPKFDANEFMRRMRGKSMALIGDSIMRNQVQSLLCMLSQEEEAVQVYHDVTYKSRRWSFPSHEFSLSVIWTPFLTKAHTFEDDNGVSTAIIQLHLDELDPAWTDKFWDMDYIIIAGGKWFLKNAVYYEKGRIVGCHGCHQGNVTELPLEYVYRKVLNLTFEFIAGPDGNGKPYVIFRTTTPDHFENGEWNSGGYCNRTQPFEVTRQVEMADVDRVMRNVELQEFKAAEERASKNGVSMHLLDTTWLSMLRPDGHPGVYREFHPYEGKDRNAKIQNDCLHWCLPGAIDAWNDLIMEILSRDSQ
ncbi:hypothetical protein M569_03240, partial [Genlisea aurea]